MNVLRSYIRGAERRGHTRNEAATKERFEKSLQLIHRLHEASFPGNGQMHEEDSLPTDRTADRTAQTDGGGETKEVEGAKVSSPGDTVAALERWEPALNAMRDAAIGHLGQGMDLQTRALRHLQRMLLDAQAEHLSGNQWHALFQELVFPVVDELLKQTLAAQRNTDTTEQRNPGSPAPPSRNDGAASAGATAVPFAREASESYVVVGAGGETDQGGGDGGGAFATNAAAGQAGPHGGHSVGGQPHCRSDEACEVALMLGITLMAKTFLHKLVVLSTLNNFHVLWLSVLRHSEHALSVAQSSGGAEDSPVPDAVRELVKNMLLVMHTTGIFDAAANTAGQELWEVTWLVAEPFLPGLQETLFGNPAPPPPLHSSPAKASPAKASSPVHIAGPGPLLPPAHVYASAQPAVVVTDAARVSRCASVEALEVPP